MDLTDKICALEGDGPLNDADSMGPKLKNGVNISDLIEKGGMTFEIADHGDEKCFNMEDSDIENSLETGLYVSQFSQMTASDRKYQEIYKSIDAEEAIGQFDNLVTKMQSITEDDKVKKLIVKKGTGKRIPQDGRVWIDYIAFAEGKEDAYDSTLLREFPEAVSFNRGACLIGLEIGLKTMEYDEVAKFWIHYDYAYGKVGSPPRIPPAASVVWTVELRQVASKEELKSCLYMSRDDRNSLPFEEIYKVANDLKVTGNGFYANSNAYREAIKRYRKAIDLMENYATAKRSDDTKRNELVVSLYANLAQCYLKESVPAKACLACKAALHLPNESPELTHKIYFRYAQAKFQLSDYEAALELVKKAIGISPRRIKEMVDFQDKVQEAVDKSKKSMTSMCRKMFSSKITDEPENKTDV